LLSKVRDFAKRRPWLTGFIGLALAGILFLVLRPKPPAFEYIAQAASQGEVVRAVAASGKLRALNTVKVGAEVSGQVVRINVDFNTEVKRGQLLAQIDPTPFRAQREQALAQIQLAQANLAQGEAAVFRAQAQVQLQQREIGRREALLKDGFVSKQAFDNTRTLLEQARAELKGAQAQVMSARAQISQSRAELERASLNLSRSTISAPIDGVVINRQVDAGQTVAATFQTPTLFEIAADLTRMQVEASVDEADIGQIVLGQKVTFTVDAFPAETFNGSVKQVRKAAQENQNVVTYIVILDVDNQSGKLLPGMTANVEIVTGTAANAVRVPSAALRFKPQFAREAEKDAPPAAKPQPGMGEVWIKPASERDEPTKADVTLGLQSEEFTQVLSGVKAGDQVIVRARKRDGSTTSGADE
jgi:HlyD family secretion protein